MNDDVLAPFHEFQETEIGPIPVDWELARLGEVASFTMGQSPPSSTYNTNGDGLPFLQGKAEFGETYPTPVKWCSRPQKVATRGSVLISVRAPVGDVNIAKEDYCIGRGLASINGDGSLDNWFLFFLLIFAKQRLDDQGTGTTFKSVNRGVLDNFSIPLPPLPEQRRIAHVLNTSQRAIAAQDALIAAARELKRSLMQRLFTYGPGTEPPPTRETEIGEVPEHWRIVRVGEIATVVSGGTPSRDKPEYWGEGIPWLKTGEITYNIITRTEESISREGLEHSSARLFPVGTLLMAMYGQGVTRGKVAILGIEATTNQACAAIVFSGDIVTRFAFHFFAFRYEAIRNLGHGANQKNLSALLIKTIPFPMLPVDEQLKIVDILDTVDRKIAAEEQRRAALQELFKSMLHQLMTGQIRLTQSRKDAEAQSEE